MSRSSGGASKGARAGHVESEADVDATDEGAREEGATAPHPWFRNRRTGHRRRGAFAPTPEWRAAFHAQATEELFTSLLGYAEKRVEQFCRNGIAVGRDHADSVVQDVLGDTAMGVLRWRPERVSLLDHLKDQVRVRMYGTFVRQPQFRVESLDATDSDDEGDEESQIEAETSAAVDELGVGERVMQADLVARVVGALREALPGDADAEAILRAYGRGNNERMDILEETGMSELDYWNARRRLARAIDALPNELREAADEVMKT